MKTYFGDLHDHCGITYGLEAWKMPINRAKSQLDFSAFYRTCHVAGICMRRLRERSLWLISI